MSAHYLKEELYALVRKDDELFEFLQSGSLDGVWYWDIERPDQEWMSPEFKRLFGYEDDEVPNTSAWWQEHIDQSQLPAVMERFKRHLDDPSYPYDQVVCYKHKDGSDVWVRCRGLAIRNEAGEPIRMLGCHTDVTKLKRTESDLRQSVTELEAANKELTQFTSILSHDLQEPLRKIKIFSEFMTESLEAHELHEAKDYAERVHATADRMSSLISSMLHFTQLGYSEVTMEQISFEEVISHVLDDLSLRIEASKARVEIKGELPTLPGIKPYLYQLFLNLIGNALKFQPAGRAPHVVVRTEVDEARRMTRVAIEDNGIGLDIDKFGERIFEPFKRLHSRSAFEGTGMGLAACTKIIELHGGEITVESTLGEGSTFTVCFPHERA